MKVKILLILMGSILFLQNCAPSKITKMAAVASSGQKVGYEGTITSQKKHFVSLSPYSELDVAKDKTMFMLGIENGGEEPINIDYDNISVIFVGNGENRALKRINVQQFDDFMKDLKEEYSNKEKRYIKSALEDIKLDIEAASSRSNSSSSVFNSSSSSGSSGSSSSGFDSSFSSLSDSLSDSDTESVEYDLKDLKMDIEVMRGNNQRLQTALQEILLQPRTIMPGNSYTGIVVCDTRDMNSETEGHFQITVSLDREEHRFTFKRSFSNK